ncbi:MAG: endonuclease/exonuclease/phosphatase family protein [Kofleriaceae bacterium]
MVMLVGVVTVIPIAASAQAFDSASGYSTTQGANQWSYLDSDNVYMVNDALYAGNAWHSTTPASGDWCYVSSTQQHPGSTKDAIRRWTAPTTGTVSITGSSRMTGVNGGDGAIVYLKKNGVWLYGGVVAANDWKIGKSWALTSIPVMAGDVIDTVVNRNTTYYGDEQRITQTIQYTPQPPAFVSSAGFSQIQGLNQWSYLDDLGPMSYGSSYAGGAWQSTAAGGPDWCYISATQQHPGTNATTRDSIRRWTAPRTGIVTISGSSRMTGFNGGDGANVWVRRNGLQLFGANVPANDIVGKSWTLTSAVTTGDTIDTVVNRGQTYWGDEQALSQTVTYNDPQVAVAPVGGYALRVSTLDLAGPQLDVSRAVTAGLADIAPPSVSADRFAQAKPTTITAYVASNVAATERPKRIVMTGTVRQVCEGLRGSLGTAGTYTETVSQIYQDNSAVVAQGELASSLTIYPNNYPCATGLLRKLIVEVQATAVKTSGIVIASTPLARFTLVSRLKIMSWNIRGGFNLSPAQAGTTMAAIGAMIASEKVDAVVLQEVHVNFNSDSGFLDEMAILRSHLAPVGLTSDHFQPMCDRGNPQLSASGMAIFSRFPARSIDWQQLGAVTGHCAGGWFNTYAQKYGVETMTVAFGGGSLVLGNTHMPTMAPDGYPQTPAGGEMAMNDFGAANAMAMQVSPHTFLMGGDYNAGVDASGVPGGAFVGIMSLPQTVKLVTANSPGIHAVKVPHPGYDFIDHMLYKTVAGLSVVPIETYFRHWDDGYPIGIFNAPLSDHLPRLTIYELQ